MLWAPPQLASAANLEAIPNELWPGFLKYCGLLEAKALYNTSTRTRAAIDCLPGFRYIKTIENYRRLIDFRIARGIAEHGSKAPVSDLKLQDTYIPFLRTLFYREYLVGQLIQLDLTPLGDQLDASIGRDLAYPAASPPTDPRIELVHDGMARSVYLEALGLNDPVNADALANRLADFRPMLHTINQAAQLHPLNAFTFTTSTPLIDQGPNPPAGFDPFQLAINMGHAPYLTLLTRLTTLDWFRFQCWSQLFGALPRGHVEIAQLLHRAVVNLHGRFDESPSADWEPVLPLTPSSTIIPLVGGNNQHQLYDLRAAALADSRQERAREDPGTPWSPYTALGELCGHVSFHLAMTVVTGLTALGHAAALRKYLRGLELVPEGDGSLADNRHLKRAIVSAAFVAEQDAIAQEYMAQLSASEAMSIIRGLTGDRQVDARHQFDVLWGQSTPANAGEIELTKASLIIQSESGEMSHLVYGEIAG
ncbi:hypothetical protein IWQ60_003308 [Tieghemiomyces parasiticus]|uniref:Uncharacterized protein n=1 Tax=Tieghemiomyces parasiticus TaxID=78921 RepID=A0A9W8AAK7_9FUNG|nr:hypothetical protein IWQ60_003308 [Tieghemiomyces parasiticus]